MTSALEFTIGRAAALLPFAEAADKEFPGAFCCTDSGGGGGLAFCGCAVTPSGLALVGGARADLLPLIADLLLPFWLLLVIPPLGEAGRGVLVDDGDGLL